MIEITLDKSKSTQEERDALETIEGYQQMVAALAKSGRRFGVSLTIIEPMPNGGEYWFANTQDGQMRRHER